MSLDNFENNSWKKSDEAKKQSEFLGEKELQRETTKLLNSLAKEIADEYGIDVSEVKKMISGETLSDLESLKSSVSSEKIDIPKLKQAISQAQSQIESLSAQARESLKSGLNPYPFTPDRHDYRVSEKIFSDQFLSRIKDPKTLGDELLGASIGVLDSAEATVQYGYRVGVGIVQSPYHLWLIITGKAKSKNAKKL